MTDEQLIKEIGTDRDHNQEIDEACYRRLMDHALEYGKIGEIARRLLVCVKEMLD